MAILLCPIETHTHKRMLNAEIWTIKIIEDRKWATKLDDKLQSKAPHLSQENIILSNIVVAFHASENELFHGMFVHRKRKEMKLGHVHVHIYIGTYIINFSLNCFDTYDEISLSRTFRCNTQFKRMRKWNPRASGSQRSEKISKIFIESKRLFPPYKCIFWEW